MDERFALKRKISPQEKKKYSLEKDHPLQADAPKAFRKKWPKAKRAAEKMLRSKIRDELHELKRGINQEDIDANDTSRYKRPVLRKWQCAPLGEIIERKHERRIKSFGRKKRSQFKIGIERAIRHLDHSIQFCTVYSPLPVEDKFYAFIHYNSIDDLKYRWSRLEISKIEDQYRIVNIEPHDGLWKK